MDIRNLIELIKSYQDNEELTIEIFFKDGRIELIENIAFAHEKVILTSGEAMPESMISHAEISAA